jgi:hypothetical protein
MVIDWDQYDIWYHPDRERWIVELYNDGLPIHNKFFLTEEKAQDYVSSLRRESIGMEDGR